MASNDDAPWMAEVQAAQQRGDASRAMALMQRAAEAAPADAGRWLVLGRMQFAAGAPDDAVHSLTRAAEIDGASSPAWLDLALCHQRRGDADAEERALVRALTRDPYDLVALLMRGRLCERQGRSHEAARYFGAAATVAQPVDRLPAELRRAVEHAMQFHGTHQAACQRFLADFLAPEMRSLQGEDLSRFELALDILVGRKQRYDSQPMRFFFPRLEPVEFFPRSDFPWFEAVESQTDAIRDEFLKVLAAEDDSFVPYITYNADEPVAQWRELNHSPRWSVLHLVKDGVEVPANASRCPRTMAAWSATPAPVQPGRTPVCLFSLLKPRTHIPPHVGASNVRLVVHLPLIVPPDCSFRVGNSVRQWEPGRAWAFDDTIEHEARNDSGELRVILIFDTWHPRLSEAERRLITALNAGLESFGAAGGDYDV